MIFKFNHKKVTGILTVIPENQVKFEDEIANYNFSEQKSLKLKATMGYNKKHVVAHGETSADLCIFGIDHLIKEKQLKINEIDAILFISQTPDYIMPPTSNIIHGHFGFNRDVICMDINQGCAGYVIGLFQSFILLDQDSIRKVLLLNADVLSPKVSKRDRNSNPLIGDGASITIIEKSENINTLFCSIQMDGAGAFAINIPAGGAKLPNTMETAELVEDYAGNYRSKDHLVMKGDEVFNFVQTEVPILIEELCKFSDTNKESIDYFMFHQPNKFMLNKLADKLEIPREKMPSNVVENFGNASGVSIPTAITFNISNELTTEKKILCLSGFGVGLTWAAVIMEFNKLKFSKIIYK